MSEQPESNAWYVAARFGSERQAERVYFRLQRYIEPDAGDLELSVYRFLLRGESIVAVIGDEQPIRNVRRRIERELTNGEKVELDDGVLGFLRERREQAKQEGPWVERHFRPGQGFHFDR